MNDETCGREDAAQDAQACAEALESLDRVAVGDIALDEEFDDAQDNAPGEEVEGAVEIDEGEGDIERAQDEARIEDAEVEVADEAKAEGQSESDTGEATMLLSDLPADDSLTCELPGLGSAPAVDETIAMGDIPLPSVPSAREAQDRRRKMSPKRRN